MLATPSYRVSEVPGRCWLHVAVQTPAPRWPQLWAYLLFGHRLRLLVHPVVLAQQFVEGVTDVPNHLQSL